MVRLKPDATGAFRPAEGGRYTCFLVPPEPDATNLVLQTVPN
jgi:hypothetical protein